MRISICVLIAALTAAPLFAAPPNAKPSSLFLKPTTPLSTPSPFKMLPQAAPYLKLPQMTPLLCISNRANAPERIASAICRSVIQCSRFADGGAIPAEFQEELNATCLRDSASHANTYWDNLGLLSEDPSTQESRLTASQLREEIIAGRVTVNTDNFCTCLNALSSQTCETIGRAILGPTSYDGFENLIPETPECEAVFGR